MVREDANGYYRIIGRVDDVINVSGHRIGRQNRKCNQFSCNGCRSAVVVSLMLIRRIMAL